MNFTTIEQSKSLVEAGLNPDTADMCYTNESYKGFAYTNGEYNTFASPYQNVRNEYEEVKQKFCQNSILAWELIPCWSTGALIELLPKAVLHDGIFYKLITFHDISAIQYCNLDKDKVLNTEVWNTVDPKSQGYVYGLIKMIFWLLKNGFIKKVEQ